MHLTEPVVSYGSSVFEESCCRSVLDLIKRILYEDICRNHGTKPDSLLDALIEVFIFYLIEIRMILLVPSDDAK